MTSQARGAFEVKLAPLPTYDTAEGSLLGRMSIDKQFHGDLQATSKGEMLSAGTTVKGSAGCVAIERVTGTLGGRSGTFVLQHSATLNRGEPQLGGIYSPSPPHQGIHQGRDPGHLAHHATPETEQDLGVADLHGPGHLADHRVQAPRIV